MQVLIMLKFQFLWTLNYNLKILNLTESKLIDLLTQLKGFKFEATLVLVFKIIENEDKTKYDAFYSRSKVEIIINGSKTDNVF